MHSKNLAIMFTDMKGFTSRTSSQTRVQNEKMLHRHRDLVTRHVTMFDGRVVKSLGDAFLLTFESSTNAVLAAVEIQKCLAEDNKVLPQEERVEVRIAISAGDVRVDENDVFGEPVNIASRLERIAPANEILFTDSVLLSMNRREVPFEELGSRKLEGVPYEVKIYRAGTPGTGAGLEAQSDLSAMTTMALTEVLKETMGRFSQEPGGRQLRVVPLRHIVAPITAPKAPLCDMILGLLRFASGSGGGGIQVSHSPSMFRTVDIGFSRALSRIIQSPSSESYVIDAMRGAQAAKLEISFGDTSPITEPGVLVNTWKARCTNPPSDPGMSFGEVFEVLCACHATICLDQTDRKTKTFKLKFPPAFK